MNFDASTPRTERTIAGRAVTVIAPYAAGHVLTEAESAMLNQTVAENFSNNLRKKIEAGETTGEGESAVTREFTDAEVQSIVDTYMAEYEPGVRRSGDGSSTRVTDPVEREARKLARAKVNEVLKSRNVKAKDIGAEGVAELVGKLFDKNRDAFMAQGKKVVAALEKAAAAGSDGLDLDLDFGGEQAAA